eukprot:CAMPEP_0117605194 /NCGR_PEP_ID=MMETSP0784-20121206/79071_1 /TAXON_ID=39447 /ORGANISM="" /LENGTH=374 /DNA_ID=CAMNT_0005408237 /DNA_START=41 /DNA_END=1165 /DNA_ORIENTATION=+
MDDVAQAAECPVCFDSLLSQEAAALRCGHVSHSVCLRKWFEVSKGNCPKCRKVYDLDDLRVLHFTLASSELETLRGIPAEECQRLMEKAEAKQAEMANGLGTARLELEEVESLAEEQKRRRIELNQQTMENENQAKAMHEEFSTLSEKYAALQTHVDKDVHRQERKLPIAPAREDDADVKEERRKLRSVRLMDRVQQLHDALASARQSEIESSRLVRVREESLLSVEAELAHIRHVEARLARELRVAAEERELLTEDASAQRRDTASIRVHASAIAPAAASVKASAHNVTGVTSIGSSSSMSEEGAATLDCADAATPASSSRRRDVTVPKVQPAEAGHARAGISEEDVDLGLYSGRPSRPSRSAATGGLLGAAP